MIKFESSPPYRDQDVDYACDECRKVIEPFKSYTTNHGADRLCHECWVKHPSRGPTNLAPAKAG